MTDPAQLSAPASGVLARARHDFDCIARLSANLPEASMPHERWLLRQVPARCQRALEVGCGTGRLTRLLAARAGHVTGVDLSAEMIRVARPRCSGIPNLELLQADALTCELPWETFDLIVSVATLHHLPLGAMLFRLRRALRPGGLLVVLDLVQDESLLDRLISVMALPFGFPRWWAARRGPPALEEAWRDHVTGERYPTLSDVRATCRDILPDARVRRHLLWRYSLRWRRPR